MKRSIFIVVLAIFCCLTSTVIADDGRENKDVKVKIGAILSLTGDIAWFGQAVQKGIQMALAEKGNSDIEVVYDDDMSLNKMAIVNGTRRLVDTQGANVLLVTAVNSAATLSSILQAMKISALVIWDSNKSIAKMSNYVFGFGFSNELAGEKMAEFAYSDKGSRRIAIIGAHDEWSEIINAAFKQKFISKGGEVVYEAQVVLTTTDFRTIVAKLKAAGADSVYFTVYMAAGLSFVKQAREQGFAGNFFTGDAFSENEIEQLGKAAEGIYVAQVWAENEEFRNKYRNFFKTEKIGSNVGYAALGYDAISFIADVLGNMGEKRGKLTAEELKAAFSTHSFNGVTGQTDFRKGRLSTKEETIVVVKDGKFVVVH